MDLHLQQTIQVSRETAMNEALDGIVLLRKNGAAMGIVQAYAPAESKEETNPKTSGDHWLLLGEVVVPAGTLHQGILRATSILTDISQILSVDESLGEIEC